MFKFSMMAVLCLALSANFAFAAKQLRVNPSPQICDRTITYDKLTKDEKDLVDANKMATRFDDSEMVNGYYVGYVFKTASFDAELVMGVYSSCHEHAGKSGLGDFIKRSIVRAKDVDHPGNPFQVFYEQQVDWPYDNGEYVMENTISAEQNGYILNSTLKSSTDAGFSPKVADGYVRVVPHSGGKVFVVACNYMQPRTGSWSGTFNDLSKKRLTESGNRLMDWVTRVNKDAKASDKYRTRLHGFFGN